MEQISIINQLSALRNVLAGDHVTEVDDNFLIEKVLAKNRLIDNMKEIYICINDITNNSLTVIPTDKSEEISMIQCLIMMDEKEMDLFIEKNKKKYENDKADDDKTEYLDISTFLMKFKSIDLPLDNNFNKLLYNDLLRLYPKYINKLTPISRFGYMVKKISIDSTKYVIGIYFEKNFGKIPGMRMFSLDKKRLIAKNCWSCGKENTLEKKSLTCGGCRLARYCSKECQSKSWKSFHKKSCAILNDV